MTRAPRPAGGPSGAGRWVAVGTLLVVAALVLVTLALRPPVPGGVGRLTAADARTAAPVTPPGSPLASAPAPEAVPLPEHLTIPAIGVATDLVRLGLRTDRTVEVPADGVQAGWFEDGTPPGQPGASVVLGHVDTEDGPAVFHRLAELGRGDRVLVRLDDGSVARFAVRRVATYANADFPAEEVYAGSPDGRALNLVTCGGWYDAARGGWQGNVVVFAELV